MWTVSPPISLPPASSVVVVVGRVWVREPPRKRRGSGSFGNGRKRRVKGESIRRKGRRQQQGGRLFYVKEKGGAVEPLLSFPFCGALGNLVV